MCWVKRRRLFYAVKNEDVVSALGRCILVPVKGVC